EIELLERTALAAREPLLLFLDEGAERVAAARPDLVDEVLPGCGEALPLGLLAARLAGALGELLPALALHRLGALLLVLRDRGRVLVGAIAPGREHQRSEQSPDDPCLHERPPCGRDTAAERCGALPACAGAACCSMNRKVVASPRTFSTVASEFTSAILIVIRFTFTMRGSLATLSKKRAMSW